MASPLCTVEEVTAARRDSTGGARDALTARYIDAASVLIARFSGRQFVIEAAPAARRFLVEALAVRIDDLSGPPSLVRLLDQRGQALATITDQVRTLPRNPAGEPLTRIVVEARHLAAPGAEREIEVTGTWGWPEVPADVREACVDTVCAWLALDSATVNMSGDRFEPGQPVGRALTLRAKELLRPLRRRMGIA